MGQLFKSISDEALKAYFQNTHVDECPLCHRDRPLLPLYAWDWQAGLNEMCAECIRTIPTRTISELTTERKIKAHLEQIYPEVPPEERERLREAIVEAIRHTPLLPKFCQADDWPLCCGDIAEYVGNGLPEWKDPGGLSLFKCPRCGQVHEVFEFT